MTVNIIEVIILLSQLPPINTCSKVNIAKDRQTKRISKQVLQEMIRFG